MLSEQPSFDEETAKRLFDLVVPYYGTRSRVRVARRLSSCAERKASPEAALKPRELLTRAERHARGIFETDAEWMARCRVDAPAAYPFGKPDTPEHLVEAYAAPFSDTLSFLTTLS